MNQIKNETKWFFSFISKKGVTRLAKRITGWDGHFFPPTQSNMKVHFSPFANVYYRRHRFTHKFNSKIKVKIKWTTPKRNKRDEFSEIMLAVCLAFLNRQSFPHSIRLWFWLDLIIKFTQNFTKRVSPFFWHGFIEANPSKETNEKKRWWSTLKIHIRMMMKLISREYKWPPAAPYYYYSSYLRVCCCCCCSPVTKQQWHNEKPKQKKNKINIYLFPHSIKKRMTDDNDDDVSSHFFFFLVVVIYLDEEYKKPRRRPGAKAGSLNLDPRDWVVWPHRRQWRMTAAPTQNAEEAAAAPSNV